MSSNLPLRVLIVDDDRITRLFLKSFLIKSGYTVFEASNGLEAIAVFDKENPALILIDVSMPVMTGYEAATIIKQRPSSSFVPIIFLTALSDDESFAKCVASGGDDFLAKPVNKVLLTAKITAMQRIRLMNQELEHYKSRTEEEIELTHHVLKALTKRMNSQHIHELNYWQISAGHFSGDLIIYDKSPSGKLYLLLADFTGHGFSAAIGSLPTADIFFAMTARDFNVADIVTEINRKLSEIMPVSHFCAAALICFDSISRQIDVFNGGLPPILLFDAEGNIAAQIKSTNLALGILSAESFTAEINIIENIVDSRLIIYSDGLTEAQNAAGEMFGEERLCKILSSNRLPADLTKSSLIDFINHCPLNDDVSFVTLNF